MSYRRQRIIPLGGRYRQVSLYSIRTVNLFSVSGVLPLCVKNDDATPMSQAASYVPFIKRDSWWRHQMEIFSTLLVLCEGNSPMTGEFPSQRPMTPSFGVLFDLCLNKRLRKQSWRRWFETPSRSLWRCCNATEIVAWTSNYIHCFTWDVITRPWPNINVGLSNNRWKLVHGWVITPIAYVDGIIYPCPKLNPSLPKLRKQILPSNTLY